MRVVSHDGESCPIVVGLGESDLEGSNMPFAGGMGATSVNSKWNAIFAFVADAQHEKHCISVGVT